MGHKINLRNYFLHKLFYTPKYSDTFEKATDSFIKKYYKNYISEKDVSGYNSLNDRWIYRMSKKDAKDKFYSEILPYYADDFPYAKNNIIGIGDLNNGHSTMSYIYGRLFYVLPFDINPFNCWAKYGA